MQTLLLVWGCRDILGLVNPDVPIACASGVGAPTSDVKSERRREGKYYSPTSLQLHWSYEGHSFA